MGLWVRQPHVLAGGCCAVLGPVSVLHPLTMRLQSPRPLVGAPSHWHPQRDPQGWTLD